MATSRTAASDRQRAKASAKGVAARLRAVPRESAQPKETGGPTAYRRAASDGDTEIAEMRLLVRTVTLLQSATDAEAWTAVTRLHAMAVEQTRAVRAARAAKAETTSDEALAAEARDLMAGLPESVRLRLVEGG